MSEAAVLTANAGGVATITLNRPRALNALDRDLTLGLRDAVLGGDLKWFDELVRSRSAAENQLEFERFVHEVHPIIVGLRRMPKPVIASVSGAAAGFGMSLMMACDLVIAADTAYFSLAYTLIGATPDGGSTFALPRIVGARKAMEIALLAERFDAASAERLGLVNRVVPLASLEQETAKLAARLAAGPTAVYGRTKALLNASSGASLESQLQREAEAFAQSAAEPDFAEGLRAFIEKRKPAWRR